MNSLLRCYIALNVFYLAGGVATAAPASRTTGFVENKGQLHTPAGERVPNVKYSLSLLGMNVQLRSGGFSYDAWTRAGGSVDEASLSRSQIARRGNAESSTYHFHRVDIDFVGGRSGALLEASGTHKDLLHYYNALVPDGATSVQHFDVVIYREVWPHIDVQFVAHPANGKGVEYNFILHSGARVSDIRLRYRGADEAALVNETLRLKIAGGTLSETIPASFWAGSRKLVDVRYSVLAEGADAAGAESITVGFAAPEAGKVCRQPLVIDPTPNLSWATLFGSTDYDIFFETTADSADNIYAVGYTENTATIATAGAHQTVYGGLADGVLFKYDKFGVRLWSTYYGGSNFDYAFGLCLDSAGAPIVVGSTSSATAIATPGAYQTALSGGGDGFLAKFNPAGVRQWATYYGGTSSDGAADISIDSSGALYIVGATESYFLATSGVHQTTPAGGVEGYLAKFSTAGVRIWCTYTGGSSDDYPEGICVDRSGAIIIAGSTHSTNGISTPGAHQAAYTATIWPDAFVQKFGPTGQRLWGTYYGGSDREAFTQAAVDSFNNIYLFGNGKSATGVATPGAHQTVMQGPAGGGPGDDGYLVKLNPAGARQWGTYVGGTDTELGMAMAVTPGGDVYVSGETLSQTGIATPGAWKEVLPIFDGDAYLIKFSTGGVRQWGTYFGGNDGDQGRALFTRGDGRIVLGGMTRSTSGLATTGAQQTTNGGFVDGFMASFTDCPVPVAPFVYIWALDTSVCAGDSIHFNTFVNATGGYPVTYQWLRNGTPIAGATAGTYASATLTSGDSVSCVVVSSHVCAGPGDTSSAVTVIIHPLPVPTITATGSVLNTQSFASYQWLRDGTTIPGATSQSYTATQSGTYRVIVTASNGCSDTSGIFNFTTSMTDVTGIAAAIRIFPNPTSNVTNIESPVAVDAVVCSVDGREIVRVRNARMLALESLPDGLYFVSIVEHTSGALLRVEKVTKGKH